MNSVSRHTRLNRAALEDRAAKSEALQRGLVATKPLTVVRLGELCALGERMIAADRALRLAGESVAAEGQVRGCDGPQKEKRATCANT
jgi:hypothetical protein